MYNTFLRKAYTWYRWTCLYGNHPVQPYLFNHNMPVTYSKTEYWHFGTCMNENEGSYYLLYVRNKNIAVSKRLYFRWILILKVYTLCCENHNTIPMQFASKHTVMFTARPSIVQSILLYLSGTCVLLER